MPRERIRVCQVISQYHPRASGAERQALAQARELTRRGHEVHVVTRALPRVPRDESLDGVFVHRWVRAIEAGPLFAISFVAGVVRSLARLRDEFDVVHTHQALWESIACGVAQPWLKSAPTLIQPASSGYFGEAREMARTRGFPLLRRLALQNTAFAAISGEIEREWLDLGVPTAKIRRTVSGVDTSHFRPGPSAFEATLPPRPRVVFTGRLHAQKNLQPLLQAWSGVVCQHAASLILLGDGPDRPSLEAHARELGIADSVFFLGRVDDPADYLRAADLFVLPSVAEGMSNSLLEAMATGLPCLASDIGGNRDLLGDLAAGLLIPADDASRWTERIVALLRDAELRRRLAASVLDRVATTYALPVVVDHYIALYNELLDAAG